MNSESQTIEDTINAALATAIEHNDHALATDTIASLQTREALRYIGHLSLADRDALIQLIPAEAAARLVEEAPPELASDLVERLDPDVAANIIGSSDSEYQADTVRNLPTDVSGSILQEMAPEEAQEIRNMVQFTADFAGGMLHSDSFNLAANLTVGEVVSQLRDGAHELDRFEDEQPYIVDTNGTLIGTISLRGLLVAQPNNLLADIVVPTLHAKETFSLDELQELFADSDLARIPVINHEGFLKGAVEREAVNKALLRRLEHDSLAIQGVGEELRSMPTRLRSKRRLAWLSANIVLNTIAAFVISAYEETLVAVIALAVFLPMVSDMSGCSGNQAVGVTMRELTLGLAKPRDVFHVWKKEVSVGLINGCALGILIGVLAWVWKGSAFLGLVIGLALAINTVIAVSIGGVVPLVLKRFNIDPAVASGPILTTVTDMAGFFLVLSLATLFMPYLLA